MLHRKSKRFIVKSLYRRLFHRRGHRVHSPFAFNLITRVIEEKNYYYSYDDIELERKKLLYINSDKKQTKRWIRPKYGRLLFRLTNYFKPHSILYIGPPDPVCLSYLTAYSSKAVCHPFTDQAGVLNFQVSSSSMDFVYWDLSFLSPDKKDIFSVCKNNISDKTILVLKDIYLNKQTRKYWKDMCDHTAVTVTFDLYSLGIIILNKKFHKRAYKVHF